MGICVVILLALKLYHFRCQSVTSYISGILQLGPESLYYVMFHRVDARLVILTEMK